MSDTACRILAGVLEARTGQQLTMSRRWRIETALAPLMRERGIRDLDELVTALVAAGDDRLREAVVEALINNETFFFRDRAVFELLFGPALDRLARARAASQSLSIWCAGCSSGQEAYSIAIALAEQKARWAGWKIDILGTDVSRTMIDRARGGVYSQFEVQRGLPVTQMIRWFDEYPGSAWRISPELKRAVRFEVHNLVDPPPPPRRFDIILCRNVLLYFCPATRARVFARLAEAAAEDGALMLGAGETVIGQTTAFASDPDCRGLYLRSAADRVQVRAAS